MAKISREIMLPVRGNNMKHVYFILQIGILVCGCAPGNEGIAKTGNRAILESDIAHSSTASLDPSQEMSYGRLGRHENLLDSQTPRKKHNRLAEPRGDEDTSRARAIKSSSMSQGSRATEVRSISSDKKEFGVNKDKWDQLEQGQAESDLEQHAVKMLGSEEGQFPKSYQPVLYPFGPVRQNPSLWPDEGPASSLYRDFRAFQPLDIITIIVNESSEGKKSADTEAKSQVSILAGIAKLFGIETKKWKSNNAGIDPTKLIDASTKTNFKGEGETNRSGKMLAQVSAVIKDVLPNGLLRVEGRKSITINREEEVIVISGLVRPSDINAFNQVQSNRIADLEISFFGNGVLGDEQGPGWLYSFFRSFWPF